LIPQIEPQHSGTVMADGSVLTQATPLSGTLGNFAPMRRQADGVTFSAQGQQPNSLYAEAEQILTRGDVVDMATSQDGCARGFASHDYIGDELIARRYPLSTPITNPDGSQIFTGQCSDFSTTAADPACCDPQVQNCTKPPFASMPICACDQGDRTTSLIPARDPADPTQILYEKNPDGTTSTRPVYACVDRSNQLIVGATRTCCNAKLNGEGDIGCGSPLGVGANGPLSEQYGQDGFSMQESKGAVQVRAENSELQADGYLFTPQVPLPRCYDDAAMCVPQNSDVAKKMKKSTLSPLAFLNMRPDAYVRALNGKVVQCCSSKWCNVCPQAYSGAYGLTLLDSGAPWAKPYRRGETMDLTRDDYLLARPSTDSSPFISTAELREQNSPQVQAEWDWNMGLFRDGWPFFQLTFNQNDGEYYSGFAPDPDTGIRYNPMGFAAGTAMTTGWGAWLPLSSVGYIEGWPDLYDAFQQPNSRYNGSTRSDAERCFGSGRAPCAFPGIKVASSGLPKSMADACADAASGQYSSWEILKRRLMAGNYGGSNVVGETMNRWTLNMNPHSGSPRQPFGAAWWSWGPGGTWHGWNSPARRLLTSYDDTGMNGGEMSFALNVTDGTAKTSYVKSATPTPKIFPIDYLNEVKAKMTIGQEFEPIRLCSEAVPLCTDPKLEQYGAGMDAAGNGTGGLGADQGSPWGNGGDGGGIGADGNGGSGMNGNASNPCAGITDPVALQACQNSFGGQGGGNGPEACNQITDPIAYLACLAANGFGDGSIPVECVGLTGDALMQCIRNHFGFGGGGGLGVGGTPEGGIRGGAGGYGTMTNPFGPGGSGGYWRKR
jgi:hypothetical protein